MGMTRATTTAGRQRPTGSFELFTWYFMRLSGIALIFLVLGHLAIMHVFGSVENVTADFVAARLSNPLWRTYDLTMVILALLHGANGARWIVDDYVHGDRARLIALSLLYSVVFLFIVLGTLILLVYQPSVAQAGGTLSALHAR